MNQTCFEKADINRNNALFIMEHFKSIWRLHKNFASCLCEWSAWVLYNFKVPAWLVVEWLFDFQLLTVNIFMCMFIFFFLFSKRPEPFGNGASNTCYMHVCTCITFAICFWSPLSEILGEVIWLTSAIHV